MANEWDRLKKMGVLLTTLLDTRGDQAMLIVDPHDLAVVVEYPPS